jgi:Bacterial type II secretion system protein G.
MKNAASSPGAVAVARPRRARWSNPLLVLGDAALVLLLAGGGWLWHANRVPKVHIPAFDEPTPNGYADLVKAWERMVRRGHVEAAIGSGERQTDQFGHVLTPAERAALVAENAPALAAAREALKLPIQVPPARSIDLTYPEFARFRTLSRLMCLEGRVLEERGEKGAAAAAYLDAMQMGNALMGRSFLLSRLVGIACEAIGRNSLLPLADRLTADEARETARRLEGQMAARAPFAETFEAEKWYMQQALLQEFRKSSLYAFALSMHRDRAEAGAILEANGEGRAPALCLAARAAALMGTFTLTKAGVMKANADYMDRMIAQAGKPYPEAIRPVREEPTDAINRVFLPGVTQTVYKEVDARAQNALLLAKLALHAWQAEHRGNLPETLGELVTAGYLKAVPTDPFAADHGAPLRYRRGDAAGRYTLYSVGPDGKDDFVLGASYF